MRDLPLLFGRFVQFCRFIILQAPPKNLEDFRSGFACGANNKYAFEPLFVGAVTFGESGLDILVSDSNPALFFA